MKTVFENIIEKLEKEKMSYFLTIANTGDEKLDYSYEQVGNALDKAIEIVKQEAEKFGRDTNVGSNGWIPVEEELPRDCDNRFYMCIVENHEEDLPMFCQYDEEYGFGFLHDIYDEHTLGFVDSEFKTNEELGYEKVIAWQQLLPYRPKGE